jgi:16S rRNA (cytidine1402-2'-O)-methyltransferase
MPAGTLFLIATPIGNLEDITFRALRLLKEADLIACEDTRHTAKLLSHYGITTRRESYHGHNESVRTERLLLLLREGKNVALVSDAGTPLVSDPGFTLVAACRREGITVTPVPGPTAAIAALAASGFPTDRFYFAGFLPSRHSQRRRALEGLAAVKSTLIVYEAPHRVLDALEDMIAVLGNRKGCLARELTKVHEEWVPGTLAEILQALAARDVIRGEITLIVEGGTGEAPKEEHPESLEAHLAAEMLKTGVSRKEALKAVARQRGLSRREAYHILLQSKKSTG